MRTNVDWWCVFEEIDNGGGDDLVLLWATGLLVGEEGGEVGQCDGGNGGCGLLTREGKKVVAVGRGVAVREGFGSLGFFFSCFLIFN